jgi:flavin reductase (DIM6/NTAB) family NADH-FMN oxidoreductase RutF
VGEEERTVGERAFRRAMGRFATGVTVVAVDSPDGVVGMTANALASVSLDPILVLVCVEHRARIWRYMLPSRMFSINVLRADQETVSRYFAGGWREGMTITHRFEAWAGAPRLVGALAAVRCVVDRVFEGGDHGIVLSRVSAVHEGEPPEDPLLFFGGRYMKLNEP